MLKECENRISATCAIAIDNEYILFTTWEGGDLYKISLSDYTIKLVGIPSDFGHYFGRLGNTFSRMIKKGEKVYLVGFQDAYEIMEYDIKSGKFRMLYQNLSLGTWIFDAFLIDGRIYLLPYHVDESICIYSIEENQAEYINWKELLTGEDYDLKDCINLYSIDVSEKVIYGAVYDTSYVFQLEITPTIKCKMYKLEDNYRIANINTCEDKVYITLINQMKMIYFSKYDKANRINAIELNGEKIDNQVSYIMPRILNNKIFLFPYLGNNEIEVIDRQTREQKLIRYPKEFHRNNGGRLFWEPIFNKDKLFLLPHSGNGMLVLDTNKCNMDFVKWEKSQLEYFVEKASFSKLEKKCNTGQCVGSTIYNVVKNN